MQIKTKLKIIGDGHPVFLIAEVGVNHNGSVKRAHDLIDAAADAKADAVKFQTFLADELVSTEAPLAGHHVANIREKCSHYELIKKLELPFDAFGGLKQHCENRDLVFISTPYDIPSAELLLDIGSEIIKIASSEMMNYPLLEVVGRSKIPAILSTGMSHWPEIVESISFMRSFGAPLVILKCTSNYPASPDTINLRGIMKMKEAFPDVLVGFSDHMEGPEASIASLGLGVSIIERHFTLDKGLWGPDHRASMEPREFKEFVDAIRKTERALGARDWEIKEAENFQRETMQKGVYARRDIHKGEEVQTSMVKFLRPRGKMTPKEFYLGCAGKKAVSNIPEGSAITLASFQADVEN